MTTILRALMIILTGLSVVICGCSGGSGGNAGPVEKADPSAFLILPSPEDPLDSASTVVAMPVADLVAANNGLAFHLCQSSSENTVVAPNVVVNSLGKLYAGARTNTSDEIAAAAGFSGSRWSLLPTVKELNLDFSGRFSGVGGVVQTDSSVEVQNGYGYLQSYVTSLADNFGSKPILYNFAASGNDTRLRLSDSFNVSAKWETPFDPSQTSLEWFAFLEKDKVAQMSMLHQQGTFPAFRDDGYLAVELRLITNDLALLVVLPDAGRFREVEAAMNDSKLKVIASGLTPVVLDFFLPKFSFTSTGLGEALKAYGLATAMGSDRADFSGVDGTKDLYLSSLNYSTGITLDETGVSCVSNVNATLVDAHPESWTNPNAPGYWSGSYGSVVSSGYYNLLSDTCAGPPLSIPVKQGRPFLFALRDIKTGSVLFLGRVVNPKPSAEVLTEGAPTSVPCSRSFETFSLETVGILNSP